MQERQETNSSRSDSLWLSQHKPTTSPKEAYYASDIEENAVKAGKGSATASEALLQEVLTVKRGGYLKDVVRGLENSGNAKVTYDANGDVEHIVFNGSDGKAPVDIDLQHKSVNGKSRTQIKETEVRQAKEFTAASLAAPKMTDASGKPLSPEAQAAANALVGALLDGDTAALTKVSQQIMQNPDMAKSIQEVLDLMHEPSSISFGQDADGQPYMKAEANESSALIVPASGPAYAVGLDTFGNPDNSNRPGLEATMKSASGWSLSLNSDSIEFAEVFLEMTYQMPTDGYTNMKALEKAYLEPAQ